MLTRLIAIFRRIFPHAAAQNLRLISLTIPGYPGSSPLTDAQAASLSSNKFEEIAEAVFQLSQNLAFGIAHLIRIERLPPLADVSGSKSGGVRILGWSAGNVFLFSLLANLERLDKEVNALLERYVTSMIIYGEPDISVTGTKTELSFQRCLV